MSSRNSWGDDGEWWCPRFCLISRALCVGYPRGHSGAREAGGSCCRGQRRPGASPARVGGTARRAQPGSRCPGLSTAPRGGLPAPHNPQGPGDGFCSNIEPILWVTLTRGKEKKSTDLLERPIYFRKKVFLQTGELRPGHEVGCLMTKKKTKLMQGF